MSLPVILAIVWLFAATGVAMLPMRLQFPPGVILLIAAPVLIIWLGSEFGWIVSIGAFAAFLSMFRNPLLLQINRKAVAFFVRLNQIPLG